MKFEAFLSHLGIDDTRKIENLDYNIQVSPDSEELRGWKIKDVEFDHYNKLIIINEEEV